MGLADQIKAVLGTYDRPTIVITIRRGYDVAQLILKAKNQPSVFTLEYLKRQFREAFGDRLVDQGDTIAVELRGRDASSKLEKIKDIVLVNLAEENIKTEVVSGILRNIGVTHDDH